MTSRSRRPQPPRRVGAAGFSTSPSAMATAAVWSERADLAESAILTRHLRPLLGLPGTELGVVGWPATRVEKLFLTWHYWWQAHLLDCVIDAAVRVPTAERRRRIATIARSHRLRNFTGWTNRYYDDMAWLAIALDRAIGTQELGNLRGGLRKLQNELYDAWAPEAGGGILWRVGGDYYNTPANGPAGIVLARLGYTERATQMADWIDATLRDPGTDLILDGIHLPSGEIERPVHSYCQGVVLGLETELARHTGEPRHTDRVVRLLDAVEKRLTERLVITGGSGGDGGLFRGILARYLAVVAVELPGDSRAVQHARRTAAAIVRASATAAWANRLEVESEPLFGHDWSTSATLPDGAAGAGHHTPGGSVTSSRVPERDLSVQLSGWMLMEAAHRVTAAGL